MSILLDTDVFIDILRFRAQAEAWITTLQTPPLLSGVAALEVAFGARSARDLRDIRVVESRFRIVWPEATDMEQAAQQFASLRLTHGIGGLDAVTAAIALRLNLTLATYNVKHFRSIQGLKTVQPYTRA